MSKELGCTADATNLFRSGFDIEYRWEVAPTEIGAAQKMTGLRCSRSVNGEEMIGAYPKTVSASCAIVGAIERIKECGALGRLDIKKGNGIVYPSVDGFPAGVAQMRDAKLGPMDGISTTADEMLILGDIDAVDAFGGVGESFAEETPVAKFSHT